MLRPERMSKVSVTGSRAVMATVIETIHDLNLVHLSDYDGSWAGFDNGDPIEGADEASERLVTVRALESTLDLDDHEAEPAGPGLPNDWEDRLETVRTRVNDLDDRRGEHRDELRRVEEELDRVGPFAELGIDLDLLSGYDHVDVVVGEAPTEELETALKADDDVRAFETFTGGDVVAIAAAPVADAEADGLLDDALVGVEFTRHEVPDVDQSPSAYVGELEDQQRSLETEIEEIDAELDEIAREEGTFLLGVERELTIEVQRTEAPLRFATTGRAFVAEGWIPADEYDAFESGLRDAVGARVEIELLEVADYDEGHGPAAHGEEGGVVEPDADEDDAEPEAPKAAADGGTRAATDGGSATASGAGSAASGGAVTMDDEPPVVLDNITPAKPFEMLVQMVGQPKYSELDPTVLIFLTYPFAFGFMIGDVAYGLLYLLMGIGAWKVFDSSAGKAMGTIGIWAGAFTMLFGWLYDDMFGIHMEYFVPEGLHEFLSSYLLMDSLSKGLQETNWAMAWIVFAIVFGLFHLNLGLILGFVNELSHGLKAAVYERLSWILTMNGLFAWIFSSHAMSFKPEFLVGSESALNEFVGFTALPEVVGLVGLVAALIGVVMVGIGEGAAGIAETPAWAFGHVLSYLRMTAVLLAKGGMAFAVNLIVFGGYSSHGTTAFNLPTYDVTGYEQQFGGIAHIEPMWIGIPLAILVFVLGHVLVLLLGITSAGIQMLRLEYVEFMQKFYDGGGEEYEPFGHEADGAVTAD